MKYIGFVITHSPEEGINAHNYFLNGTVKVDIGETGCAEFFNSSKRRTLLSVIDASASEINGADAAFLCADALNDCLGLDFDSAYSICLNDANEIIKGRSFQAGGKTVCVDTGLLFFQNDYLKAYNVGDVPIFYLRDKKLNKLSGKAPKTVEIEQSIETEDGIDLKTVTRKTAPYIGYMSEDYVIEPHISEKIKVKNKDVFLVLSKSVIDTVGENIITEILNNDKLKIDEKAEMIMDTAVEKNSDGVFTVLITLAKDNVRLFGVKLGYYAFAILLLCFSLFGGRIRTGAESLVEKWKIFVSSFTYRDIKPEIVADPWTPLGRDEEEDAKNEEEAEPVQNTEEEQKKNEEALKQNKPATQQHSVTQPSAQPVPKASEQQQREEVSNEASETITSPEPQNPTLPPVKEDSNVELPIDFN